MLVMSKGGLSAAQAEHYYQEKYSQDDYYSEDQRITGQWFGIGATELGLQGEVTLEAFRAVLNGRDPRTGQVLVPPTQDGKRRAGWDATFNAPKSVSLQVLIGGDDRLREAHRQAVQQALSEFERYVQSRVEGGTRRVTTGNMVAARFEHSAARPSRTGRDQGVGPDPHLHTHVVVANMTQRADGQWRGVEALDLYRSQAFATAVYRAELARTAQSLGYEVSLTGQRGEWELSGYSRADIEAFSQRRQDITQRLAEQGLNSAAAAQIAAHQTRLTKDQRSEPEMRQEWQVRAQGLGLDLPQRTGAAHDREPAPVLSEAQRHAAQTAVTFAQEHITEREAVMHTRTLETAALQRGMGTIVLDETRREITQQAGQGILLPVKEGLWAGNGYTTREMLTLEQENLSLLYAGQGQAQPLVAARTVEAWAQQKGLYADQTHVVVQTLSTRHWLSAIEGKAGATKTTTIGAMREVLEANGHTVRGFGPTTGSVRALQEAGVEAQTVAALLAHRLAPSEAKGAVWIVDESSLLATRQVHTLLHRAREAQVARVIFVGDQRQHGAIEAGRPMAQLQAAGMETARLDIIRRQRDPELRKAVELAANGETKAAVDLLHAQGRVTEIADSDQRYDAIAQEYARSVADGQQVLVVSPANAERTALNAAIRTTLQEQGHLPVEGIAHSVLINRNITGPERTWARSYQVGDVLRYRGGSQKLGIAAGAYARVEAVEADRNRLTIRTEAGVVHTYTPSKLKGIEVYREEGREFAVGERIQFRAPVKAQRIPNGALGRIEKLDPDTGQVTIRLDAGSSLTTKLQDLRHMEYGYATTSHSSQGATIDRVLVHIDTEQSVALVNQQQFYVSLSRARHDARIFTNKREELSQVVSRSWPKATALDAVANSTDGPRHDQRPEQEQKRTGARHVPPPREGRQPAPAMPVAILPHALLPSRVPGKPQRETAVLVSHRQSEWRQEHQGRGPQQQIVRAPGEQPREIATQPPRREETPAQKPERTRSIRYSR
jgi:conjugative relaxase-like TrwC/TraI family protein